MIKSNRISTICSLVDKKIIAEIGADHGYITLNLFQNAKIDFAFLTDISDNSLQKARDNFSQSNFSNNVMFLVGDGLKVFENIQKENNCKKPEQIIIAGMGGNEIIKILQNNKYSFENFKFSVFSAFVISSAEPPFSEKKLGKFLNFFISSDILTS